MIVTKHVVSDNKGYLNERTGQNVLGFSMASWYDSAQDAQDAKARNPHLCNETATVLSISVIE